MQIQIHPLHIREAITSTQYTLLSHPPPHSQATGTCETSLHEILRLGLLLYLSTLLSPSPTEAALHDPLCARLKTLYISHAHTHTHSDSIDPNFSLWISFLTASLTHHAPTRAYFLSCIRRITAPLPHWDDIEKTFRSFFWVEKIHRELFRGVWEELVILASIGEGMYENA
jgi:hypothetical protein